MDASGEKPTKTKVPRAGFYFGLDVCKSQSISTGGWYLTVHLMANPAYLICIVLILPVLSAAAFVGAITLPAAGSKDGWSVLIKILAFFGAGIAEPLRYGWRILAFTLFAASQQDRYNVINALIFTSPSLAGIGACLCFAVKLKS